MRIDHHTYQRATSTALTGLLLQFVVAATLLVFGLTVGSTAFIFASLYVWIGCLVWLGLVILFYQEKMILLEELEESELLDEAATSMFNAEEKLTRPEARRLQLIHKWIMPFLSILTAVMLIVIGVVMLRFLGRLDHQDDLMQTFLSQTPHIGWALAVSMGFALVSFIYSRFVAGMGKVPAWTNLRGGSACMVGNTIILLALSIGLLFRFFENDQVLIGVCWGIPIFLFAVAAEIVINIILNLYRPRLHGESPRPAFDSKSLSLFASPDSIVRSINEAVNYQFGFDITSSWGYQLFLRSATWLLVLGLVVLLGMSTMVVVEPTQQAVRLRQGALIEDVYNPGVLFKLPWPIESAKIFDVTTIRELPLTFTWKNERKVILWTDDYNKHAVVKPKPFIVNQFIHENKSETGDVLSLVDVRAILNYRIDKNGLLDWIRFGSDEVDRRTRLTQRELALHSISQNAITVMMQDLSLDEIIGADRGQLSSELTQKLQSTLDKHNSGVHVLSVDLPLVAPTSDAAQSFEELSVAIQGEERLITAARGHAQNVLTRIAGDPNYIDSIVKSVAKYNQSRNVWDELRRGANTSQKDIKEAAHKMQLEEATAVEFINAGNGTAAAKIRDARVEKWTTLMETWARASRVASQVEAYKAAPNLYMQRMYMSVLARKMPEIKKYIIGIEPERLNIDFELKSINPLLNFADALESDDEGN
jgi:regulator of protease activity HflC (stomatin/prohibitin superfamily)